MCYYPKMRFATKMDFLDKAGGGFNCFEKGDGGGTNSYDYFPRP